MSPKVSVVMSVYNGELFLATAIDSILNQTFTDFEFIIIDDGSTDQTATILEEYKQQDKRILLIQNKTNIGLTKSLNKGLYLAKGKYIARQDVDDYSAPERLAIQIDYLEKNTHIKLLGSAYNVVEDGIYKITHRQPLTDSAIRFQMLFHNAFCHSSVMFEKELITTENISLSYDENLHYTQDYDLWCRLLQYTKVANLSQPLVTVGKHNNRISCTNYSYQQSLALKIAKQQIEKLNLKSSISDNQIKQFRHWYYNFPEQLTETDFETGKRLLDIIQSFSNNLDIISYEFIKIRRSLLRKILKSTIAKNVINWETIKLLSLTINIDSYGILFYIPKLLIFYVKNILTNPTIVKI